MTQYRYTGEFKVRVLIPVGGEESVGETCGSLYERACSLSALSLHTRSGLTTRLYRGARAGSVDLARSWPAPHTHTRVAPQPTLGVSVAALFRYSIYGTAMTGTRLAWSDDTAFIVDVEFVLTVYTQRAHL